MGSMPTVHQVKTDTKPYPPLIFKMYRHEVKHAVSL